MPINLNNFSINLPSEFAMALRKIALEVDRKAVNPAIAITLLKRYVAPLIEPQHRQLLDIQGQPTWAKLHWCYPKMIFASEKGADVGLLAAATIVRFVFENSVAPSRKFSFPKFLEVSSFRRMADYVNLQHQPSTGYLHKKPVDFLKFCKYCWRPSIKSNGLCVAHSINNRSEEYSTALGEDSAKYKKAQRLHPAFEIQLNKLTTNEELAFHNSDFVLQVFCPKDSMADWIKTRRPCLAAKVNTKWVDTTDQEFLKNLWSALYGESSVPALIQDMPQLLTPVTLRAEAWLRAEFDHPKWGGERNGASKKSVQ
jgi:hypothetical protein